MNLLTGQVINSIHEDILLPILVKDNPEVIHHINLILSDLYNNIPEQRRISNGRVYTVKILSAYLYQCLREQNADIFTTAIKIFDDSPEVLTKGVAMGILSLYGLGDFANVTSFFTTAAAGNDWGLRELAQMFFRKLITKYPEEAKIYLLNLAKSKDYNLRRFAAETLRPVVENKWIYNQPEYSLEVLRHLFKERVPYPRSSVGNNLSDLSRRLPDLVYSIVDELVYSSDKNSYWIAYRACRNLVKKEPVKAMSLLRIEEYHYKTAHYNVDKELNVGLT
jgi:3-methyladenine DNA glycosylase AlkC